MTIRLLVLLAACLAACHAWTPTPRIVTSIHRPEAVSPVVVMKNKVVKKPAPEPEALEPPPPPPPVDEKAARAELEAAEKKLKEIKAAKSKALADAAKAQAKASKLEQQAVKVESGGRVSLPSAKSSSEPSAGLGPVIGLLGGVAVGAVPAAAIISLRAFLASRS